MLNGDFEQIYDMEAQNCFWFWATIKNTLSVYLAYCHEKWSFNEALSLVNRLLGGHMTKPAPLFFDSLAVNLQHMNIKLTLTLTVRGSN